MERIRENDSRVLGLATVLKPAQLVSKAEVPTQELDPALSMERECNRVLEEARTAGLAQGLADADRQIRAAVAMAQQEAGETHVKEVARLRETRGRLELVVRGISSAVASVDEEILATSVEIAYAAVLRVIGRVHADRGVIRDICRQALDEYRYRPAVLRVASDDYPFLEGVAADESIRVEVDAMLVPGQCRLETSKGLYDTGLDVRLDALRRAFLRGLHQGEDAV